MPRLNLAIDTCDTPVMTDKVFEVKHCCAIIISSFSLSIFKARISFLTDLDNIIVCLQYSIDNYVVVVNSFFDCLMKYLEFNCRL